jgi:hypothetical protein
MRPLALCLAVLSLAVAPPAQAGPAQPAPSISLNGVAIDGITNQKFENVTVVIDGQGNVDIRAKGYAARVTGTTTVPQPAPAAAPNQAATNQPVPAPVTAAAPVRPATAGTAAQARLTRRYFLATEQSQPDGTQFDVEVFINASWIRVLKSADPQVVTEITRYLHPGPNKVTFSCVKRLQGVERRNYGRDVTLRVVVGEGNVGGEHVMIDDALVVMTRNAAEVDDKVEEFTFEAR